MAKVEDAYRYEMLPSRGVHHLTCMYAAFNHREGIVLSTVTYNDDGKLRPLFYRLSLAEMIVPYGAPEHPHPRKHAFDALVAAIHLNLSIGN